MVHLYFMHIPLHKYDLNFTSQAEKNGLLTMQCFCNKEFINYSKKPEYVSGYN